MDTRNYRVFPENIVKKREQFLNQRRNRLHGDYYPLLFLKFFGIDLTSSKRNSLFCHNFSRILYKTCFHLIYVDSVITNVSLMMRMQNPKLFLSNITNLTAILILWYIMIIKRTEIRKLLSSVNCAISDCETENKRCNITKILSLVLCIFPLFFGFAAIYVSSFEQISIIYFWKMANAPYVNYIFRYISTVGSSLMRHSFIGFVTIIYTSTCCKVIKYMLKFRKHLVKSLREKNTEILSTSFLLSYMNVLDIIEDLEEVFNGPAFVLTLSNGLSLFTLMAIAFHSRSQNLSEFELLHMIMFLITSGFSLVTIIIIASQVPLEVEKNVKCLIKFQENYILDPTAFRLDQNILIMIEGASERRIVILSGCRIIYFTRHVLLSIIGALITYGLLIMQIQ